MYYFNTYSILKGRFRFNFKLNCHHGRQKEEYMDTKGQLANFYVLLLQF